VGLGHLCLGLAVQEVVLGQVTAWETLEQVGQLVKETMVVMAWLQLATDLLGVEVAQEPLVVMA
jgi:hypothetical protein